MKRAIVLILLLPALLAACETPVDSTGANAGIAMSGEAAIGVTTRVGN